MNHGGRRQGAGRKVSATTRKTREIADQLVQDGLTPLEFMLNVLRDGTKPFAERFDAAKSAAPYMHPRLAAVEHSGDPENPIETVTRIELIAPDVHSSG